MTVQINRNSFFTSSVKMKGEKQKPTKKKSRTAYEFTGNLDNVA